MVRSIFSTFLSASLLAAKLSLAAPIVSRDSDSATTAVSNTTVTSDFLRPAFFARIAYCSESAVQSLDCGGPCEALGSGVDVLQIGGNSGTIPMYLIAHDTSTNSIVVAHQGTDPSNLLSLLNDAELALTDLNTTTFPSASGKGIQVHDGFQDTFERTSAGVLSGVQSALASTGASNVLVTGHSLGAAIATLDAMMLIENLDSSISLTTTVFGLPRVGDQAWADFVDSSLGTTLSHITNQNDPVPTVPPEFLGFVQPSQEFHITGVDSTGQATGIVACPGQDNDNCSTGNNILDTSIANHLGPYFDDISFGSSACPA
ncbi:alpha/beta-hydrolase [Gymnopus androsaceus JB14]|uniref:Alpha/beta-hydrolase n=1 Tax=Gymnopus androsaceus JB14 TaxID=1447944 RepID=A0A6A4I645_9AGAR|nr:alpha/beta-hydrolase [Gymnopus androsaceus JB14]